MAKKRSWDDFRKDRQLNEITDAVIEQSLGTLSESFQEALNEHYLEGKGFARIAAEMHISKGEAQKLVEKAAAALASAILGQRPAAW